MSEIEALKARVSQSSRERYLARISGSGAGPWWDDVVITASSALQASRYREELDRRLREGRIPRGVRYAVVADPGDRRVGSGGATLNALGRLAEDGLMGAPAGKSLADWWSSHRVLMIHSGGDARRMPQYSLAGKLFSAVPSVGSAGTVSSVFDEFLMLSTGWVARLDSGLVVASGDVLLVLDDTQIDWNRQGVSGVAVAQPIDVGSQHGVYVLDERQRVYKFLQKPTLADVRAAGGLLPDDKVAVDTGLLRFDPELCAAFMEVAGVVRRDGRWVRSQKRNPFLAVPPPDGIDLYVHITMSLTGQMPEGTAGPLWDAVVSRLEGRELSCSLVKGEFVHIGTTRALRELLTNPALLESVAKLRPVSAGGGLGLVLDSVLAVGSELARESLVIECHLEGPLHLGPGAIAHGLDGLPGAIEVPADTVVHQVPVHSPGQSGAAVLRVFGVADDPKKSLEGGESTWFGRPTLDVLARLGVSEGEVWPDVPSEKRSLWNAELFAVAPAAEAWQAARWLMGTGQEFTAERWRSLPRLSLETSTRQADLAGQETARARRSLAGWREAALRLASLGTDLRPMLSTGPGAAAAAAVAQALQKKGEATLGESPSQAASTLVQASLFFEQAGLARDSNHAREAAFGAVLRAVDRGADPVYGHLAGRWVRESVSVSAPARIDLGGGWSDTPPFCIDWGGTVLNVGVRFGGRSPIRAQVRRIEEPMVRCVSEETGDIYEARTTDELFAQWTPASPYAIPCTALRMTGLFAADRPLAETLAELGGGVEFRTGVDLPLGSGLGTSSILAAAVLQAVAELRGGALSPEDLMGAVMRLEQLLTTGGGWQDQAGGIFPGAKLLITSPGDRQAVRVVPVQWSPERAKDFASRVVLHYTGIRRIAKNLLAQIVGSYLARESSTVQILHTIKGLAMEMKWAIEEGCWAELGSLLDRHWALNQHLDPNTTNAPINRLLGAARPYLHGAKLAGAGGGGFMILLARDPDAAVVLKKLLTEWAVHEGGTPFALEVAEQGLEVHQ